MFVVAVILILASFAIPAYQNIIVRSREAVLRDDLFTMRSMIDRFTLDNKRPPASLEELAEKGYLGERGSADRRVCGLRLFSWERADIPGRRSDEKPRT